MNSKKKKKDNKMDAENKALVKNTIDINPELEETWSKEKYYLQPDGKWKKGADGRSEGKTRAELENEGLADKIVESLSLSQRRQRAMTMRKFKAKISAARKRMARRPADKERIKKRADKAARTMMKKQIIGKSGKSYQDMSASEKSTVDRRVKKRSAIIARVARKMIPQMRAKDRARIAGKSVSEELMNETPAVERMKDKHVNEREQMRKRQEQEMDRVRTDSKRKSIRAINREQVEVETDLEALALIHEAATMDQVMNVVQKNVKSGKHLMDVIWDVSRSSSVNISSRDIEREFKKRFGDPHAPAKVKDGGKRLRKKYGFKEDVSLTEMTSGEVNRIVRATKKEIAKLRKSDLPIDQEDADRLEYSFMYALNTRNLSRITDEMTRGDTEYRETVFRLVSGVIGKEATRKLHEGYDTDGYTPSGPAAAGLENTDRLQKRYKKDTPGEVVDKACREDVNESADYVKKTLPVLKKKMAYHERKQKEHDKKSVRGSGPFVRAHNAAADMHKNAAEKMKIAHAQLSNGTEDIAYYVNPAVEISKSADDLSKKANTIKEDINESFTAMMEQKSSCDLIGMKQIKTFEKAVDRLFEKFGIDFQFTKHFAERMGDERNNPCITLKELADFIKKMYRNQGKSLKSVAGAEAVVRDLQKDLNIPVVVKYDQRNDEFDVVMKTIMRKKNFRTPNKVINYK